MAISVRSGRRHHRLVRRGHPQLRRAVRHRPRRPAADAQRRRVREGLLRPSARRSPWRGRTSHRARRSAARVAPVPAPVDDHPAARRRVRRDAARSSSSCPSRRATASTSRCSSTSARGSGWSRSRRSTSALASTAIARSTSCHRSRWRSCRRSWPAPASRCRTARPDRSCARDPSRCWSRRSTGPRSSSSRAYRRRSA